MYHSSLADWPTGEMRMMCMHPVGPEDEYCTVGKEGFQIL